MFVLAHMTGGFPARGSEVITVQYMNSSNGESRGIFMENSMLVYVTMYYKSIGASAEAKIIHWYLLREVGELMFYYLWLVVPFSRKLESAFAKGVAKEASPFISEPVKEQLWEGPRRKRRLLDESVDEEDNGEEGELLDGVGNDRCRLLGPEKWDTDWVRRAILRVST